MKTMDRKYWSNWVQTLQQKKITGLVIAFLEGSGPLKLLLSQVLMGFLPLFGQYRESSWQSFAAMLENPKECQSFTAYLLEEKSS
jgi:hypothetical protein